MMSLTAPALAELDAALAAVPTRVEALFKDRFENKP